MPAWVVAGVVRGCTEQRAMLQRSRRTLQKAMHLNPLDYSLQFNMCVFAGKLAGLRGAGAKR